MQKNRDYYLAEAVLGRQGIFSSLFNPLKARHRLFEQEALNEKKEKAVLLLVQTLRKELEDGLRVTRSRNLRSRDQIAICLGFIL